MTVKDQRKDITISSSYSFFNHLEYFISLEKMKIESNSQPPESVQSVLRWETWARYYFWP